ncbi:MAG: hypothetical protein AAF266_10550 [Planctomycetota bacterium]
MSHTRDWITRLPLLAAAMSATIATGQTNLLTNGDFETNAGFSFEEPNCQDFWGGFCGWDGWNTDFVDDGEFNFSWDQLSEGGQRLANAFPAGEDPTDPVLSGDASALVLGSFDVSTPTVIFQQVAVTPGDTLRFGSFGFSDTSRVAGNGFPDTIYGQFSQNRVRMRAEFYDLFGLGGFAEDGEQIFFDPANDPGFDTETFTNPDFEDKWIEAAIETTVPIGAEFARVAILFDQVNNAGGLAFIDTVSIVNLSDETPELGDFNFDGELTADDLRMLTLAVDGDLLPADDRFDLTGDTELTGEDIAAWETLAPPVGIPGDANADGSVDLLDLDILGANFGQSPADLSTGDFNDDDIVDLLDLDILGANFGRTAASAIPEPAACLLVLAAATAGVARRRTMSPSL